MRMKWIGLAALFLFSFFFGSLDLQASEARFPTKPIEINVGFSAGGGTDLVARLVAEKAKPILGQEIVVLNKPGGGGITAAILISQARPDGYSLGANVDSLYTFVPLMDKVPYDPLKDATFICQFGVLQCGLLVRDDSPFRTFKDFIEYARANP
jgi:tripartite-type tricarboxylate transporter receptor subunit TctC